MKKKMQCMIRMDDITPDMDWKKFHQVRAVFDSYGIKPLIGIVPDNRDVKLSIEEKRTEFWEIVRSLQQSGWTVAQHGTYHQYVTKDCGILGLKKASEFAGLSYEEQFSKLQTGKNILEENGVYSDVFMAPGHTYDKNTVRALKNLGFHTVTDGLYSKPYHMDGILFIPCRLKEYRNVSGIDTICLHSNMMSEKEIKNLEQFCRKNKENIISFCPEEMKTEAVNRNFFVVLSERKELLARRFKNKISNSKRLTWYMQYTYDKNSRKKLVKRIFCLPMLIIGGKGRTQ